MDDNNTQLNNAEAEPVTVEAPTAEQTPAKRKRSVWDRLINILLISVIAVLLAVFLMRLFVLWHIEVSGSSMETTFHDEETVWVNKLASPKRGDVVVFYEDTPENKLAENFRNSEKLLIKRVIALGGDKVWVEPNLHGSFDVFVLTSDDNLIEEKYQRNGKEVVLEGISSQHLYGLLTHIGRANAYTVEEGRFFALGDNRNDSADSRCVPVYKDEKKHSVEYYKNEIRTFPLQNLYGVVIK